MFGKSSSSTLFVCLMIAGIVSLAFRETFLQSASSGGIFLKQQKHLEFTIPFEQRQDVLLATSPQAAVEMKKWMKRKKSEQLRNQPENESQSESQDDEDSIDEDKEIDKKKVSGVYQDDDGDAEESNMDDEIPTFEEADRVLYNHKSTKHVPFCTREQVIDGQWYKVELEQPPYIIHTVHLRCYPKEAYYTAPWVHHQWVPKDTIAGLCQYPDTFFEQDEFCRLADSATISVVGDSLSWEQYRSMLQLLGLHPHQNFQHQSRELETNIVHRVCNGRAAAIYRRDDKLSNVTASIEQDFPTVLVLNRGAHFVPDEELLPGIHLVIEQVRAWLSQCEDRGLTCHFFWRTSVPGHPNCKDAKGPVNDLDKIQSLIENRDTYTERSLTFHWYDYQKQNELVIAELRKANLPSLEILDGYYLLVRRPDEHRAHQNDCLHNCYPGKVDVYNQLLWHYLQAQRSDDAIAAQQGQIVPNNTVYDLVATEEARKIREAKKGLARKRI